jgi:uncharacterized protein (DUF433 family)
MGGEEDAMIRHASWITYRPEVQGGDACVRDTRIPVWCLEGYRRLGLDDAGVLAAYPALTPADLATAWAYVRDHPEEMDRAIRANEIRPARIL